MNGMAAPNRTNGSIERRRLRLLPGLIDRRLNGLTERRPNGSGHDRVDLGTGPGSSRHCTQMGVAPVPPRAGTTKGTANDRFTGCSGDWTRPVTWSRTKCRGANEDTVCHAPSGPVCASKGTTGGRTDIWDCRTHNGDENIYGPAMTECPSFYTPYQQLGSLLSGGGSGRVPTEEPCG